jgi:hypothetical protein
MRPKPLIATLTAILVVGCWTLRAANEGRAGKFGKSDAQNVPETGAQWLLFA